MWFLVAIFVASLVVSLVLTPKPKITDAVSGKLNDLSFPRANYGAPVPRIYGTVKFKAPNTIWSGDFKSVPVKKKVKTGLFSSKKQTIGYKYYVGFDLAVCLGPNFTFRRIWAGTYELWNGCLNTCNNVININLPELFGGQDKNGGFVADVALYCGDFDQPRDSYLASKVDPNVPAYVGVAHMVFRQAYIGNSTSLQPISVEGSHFSNSLQITAGRHIMANGLDANPIEVLYDLFVNDWGNLNIDAAKINVAQWREVAVKIWAESNGMSVIVSNSGKGADLCGEILSQINATMFEDPATGLFDLILLRDDYNVDLLPVLGPSEIAKIAGFTKMLWPDTYNRVRVKFTDRANGWQDDAVALAEDFANIRYQGSARSFEVQFNGVYDGDLANELASRELSNVNVPLYSFEMTLNRTQADLRPGSVFVLHWPEYNIERLVCRIRKFGLGSLQDGKLTASVVQDVFAVNKTVIAPPGGSTYVPPSYDPQPITQYAIFELPYFLTVEAGIKVTDAGSPIAIFAGPASAASIGFNAYVVGTPTDTQVLEVAPYTASAKLVGDLQQFAGFETGMLPTLTIGTLVQPEGEETEEDDDGVPIPSTDPLFILKHGTEADARAGATLFMLNGELMAYEDFTDNGDGSYVLNNVHRALLDTAYAPAVTGTLLYFFDGAEGFVDDQLPNNIEAAVYLQDISSTSVYPRSSADRLPFTPQARASRPLPADALALDGDRAVPAVFVGGDAPALSWRERNRLVAPEGIEFEPDAAEADEAGATYALDVRQGDDVLFTIDPIANGDPVPFPVDMEGVALLQLWTVRDGIKSFTPALYPVAVYPAGTVTIDGSGISIDGEGIVFDEA